MKRVIVTGASGFIGRQTLVSLVDCGYEVHAISFRRAGETLPGVHWHCTDLLDSGRVARLMADLCPTHLLHFAWYAEPGKFWVSSKNFRWLEASIALMRHFCEHGGTRVVMAGTCAEYDWNYGYCSEDITPCRPATPYGVCKNVLQKTLRSYCLQKRMSSAWGRIFFLYGPGEHSTRLVSSVINSLLRGENTRCTHGNQVRDFLHVEDVASAFVSLLDSPVEGVVNIASGRPVSLREVVLAVVDYLGDGDHVQQFGALPAPDNDPPLLVGDNRRLLKELGWKPRYDIYSGIKQTVQWWKLHREEEENETFD